MKVLGTLFAAALVVALPRFALSQTTTDLNNEVARVDSLAASQGNTKVINKISGEFSSFLGSDATAVVTGLRNGTPIMLTSTTLTPSSTPGAPPMPTTTTTTIYPPTGKMGFGNVTIALALAKEQLGQLGIYNPTPEQLKAALTGGTITLNSGTTGTGAATTSTTQTTLQGILNMRSQYKIGWGQIAQSLDVKLGRLMSSLKSAKQNLTTASTSSSASEATSSSGGGIVSGSGKSQGNSGQGASEKGNSGQGIVSASGKSVGNAYGKGIVTGSGQVDGGSSAITSAGGPGNSGQAKGHNK